MIVRSGYVRLEGGVWANMEAAKLFRISPDPRENNWRIEMMCSDKEEWLCEDVYESEEEATLALDEFFEGLTR